MNVLEETESLYTEIGLSKETKQNKEPNSRFRIQKDRDGDKRIMAGGQLRQKHETLHGKQKN
jgi:hypothetical protein